MMIDVREIGTGIVTEIEIGTGTDTVIEKGNYAANKDFSI